MKHISHLLLLYIGFVAGSLQVLAFTNKWEGLGVVILVTIILLIAGATHARWQSSKPIPKRGSISKKRSAAKSKLKVVSR
jgi:membrane protein DedA with SNARE-associated domain